MAPVANVTTPRSPAVVQVGVPVASNSLRPSKLDVWFWDETRLGLHGQVRRVWAPVGEKVEQLLR